MLLPLPINRTSSSLPAERRDDDLNMDFDTDAVEDADEVEHVDAAGALGLVAVAGETRPIVGTAPLAAFTAEREGT